jgi:1-pyrroline-5-carboxylate dehydrogenase
MNNSIFTLKEPQNETVLSYKKNSPERLALLDELQELADKEIEIPLIIGGKEIKTGNIGHCVMPHDHKHILAKYHIASEKEVKMAINAALEARHVWSLMPYEERAAIMIKTAELIAKRYRFVLNAATMLGQSKNVYQAEIDSACEIIDFLRFNAYFAGQIYNQQPISNNDTMNRIEYRPLEGFVFALSPFNFTSIAGNLSCSPVMMGNTVVWKPATSAIYSNYFLMQIYRQAGLPDGVINFVPGPGKVVGDVVLNHPELAAIHFTGSTTTFNTLWKKVGENLGSYKNYPKLVGETGGKDFIFVHHTADIKEVATAIIRGAYEFQGQKCSAASRAYIPKSLWEKIKTDLLESLASIQMGDVVDFSNLMNAVIDSESYKKIMSYIDIAQKSKDATILFGGKGDDSKGYFIQPTLIQAHVPDFVTMKEEIFGPVMTIYVYEDSEFEKTLQIADKTSAYGLTGSIFSHDRLATLKAMEILRYTAGNFYINDKPTGAVVGQQPFGGARASGTNDKAGSLSNLMRWTSPRSIKETYLPAKDFRYPYMNGDF